MSEMVERVARAMFMATEELFYAPSDPDCIACAQAAIEAMREPAGRISDTALSDDTGLVPGGTK